MLWLWNGSFLKDGEAGAFNRLSKFDTVPVQQGMSFKHAFGEEQTAFQLKLSFYPLATVTQVTQLQYSPYYCLLLIYWENVSLASLASLYVVIMLCVRGLQRNRCEWWDTERTPAFRAFIAHIAKLWLIGSIRILGRGLLLLPK